MARKKGLSRSKSQQRLMGMAYAFSKGELEDAPDQIKDVAKSFTKKGKRKGIKKLRDFAATKHTGLPMKVETFQSYFENKISGIPSLDAIDDEEIKKLTDSLYNSDDPKEKQDIYEDIMLALDDLDITEEEYYHIEDDIKKYISQ